MIKHEAGGKLLASHGALFETQLVNCSDTIKGSLGYGHRAERNVSAPHHDPFGLAACGREIVETTLYFKYEA